jgi:hypothetical protein
LLSDTLSKNMSIKKKTLGQVARICFWLCLPGTFLLLISNILDAAGESFTLTITEQSSQTVMLRCRVHPGDEFQMRTIHSLALTRYVQIYRVNENGEIILSGAIYESEGGGFPIITDGVISKNDGKIFMDKMDRLIGKTWRFRVSPLSQETFIYSNIEFPIFKLLPEGTLVIMRVDSEGRSHSE